MKVFSKDKYIREIGMRMIDANSLAKWLDKEHYVDKPTGKCDERQNRVLGICISALKNPQIAPTIDAVPVVHGRWVHCDGKSIVWYCSECGGKILFNPNPRTYNIKKLKVEQYNKFCRNCGAKMDGGSDDD